MNLYPDQQQLVGKVVHEWRAGARVVVMVSPTGGGKTRIFCWFLQEHQTGHLNGLLGLPTPVHRGESLAMAHRQELVGQMSMTLASHGIRHRILAASETIKTIVKEHVEILGRSFYDPNAATTCASVDTLLSRAASLGRWLDRITLVVVDEGHHVLRDNKWGQAFALFKNARGLLPTACPHRADRIGLGAHAGGIADAMVVGLEMRELIDAKRLAEYKIYCPKPSIDKSKLKIGSTGDYTSTSLIAASRQNAPKIVGDCTQHYLQHTPGLRGMTFTTDITTAREIADGYNQAGIPALAASSKCPPGTRERAVSGLKSGKLLQVVNVDLFGEGTDVPALQMILQARRTKSLNIYRQQAGRPMRIDPKDPDKIAYIIDTVGNVVEEHGPPDKYVRWTLDGRTPQDDEPGEDDEALRACVNPECALPYPRAKPACIYCGHRPVPAQRRTVEQVEGEVYLLDADVLEQMRGYVQQANLSEAETMGRMTAKFVPAAGVWAEVNRQRERLAARQVLNDALAWWVGRRRARGIPDDESHRELWLRHRIDIYTAQTLNTIDTLALAEKLHAGN